MNISSDFFLENTFSVSSVNTKTFILLLAQNNPLSFISAAKVDLDDVLVSCNKNEFHHIFPDNYLKTKIDIKNKSDRFCLANFAFLSQTDNRSIKDSAPSDYRKKINPNIIDSVFKASYIPKDGLDMNYADFLKERIKLLKEAAENLT